MVIFPASIETETLPPISPSMASERLLVSLRSITGNSLPWFITLETLRLPFSSMAILIALVPAWIAIGLPIEKPASMSFLFHKQTRRAPLLDPIFCICFNIIFCFPVLVNPDCDRDSVEFFTTARMATTTHAIAASLTHQFSERLPQCCVVWIRCQLGYFKKSLLHFPFLFWPLPWPFLSCSKVLYI